MTCMPHGHSTHMSTMLARPTTKVARKKVPERPLLTMALPNSALTGLTAPATHSICMRTALASHFSVRAMTMNSCATMPKPKSSGNDTKAVKRMSLRKAASWRAA